MRHIPLILLVLLTSVIGFTSSDPRHDFVNYKLRNWGLRVIAADRAWPLVTSNYKVTVAVIDTGVDFHHQALRSKRWFDLTSDEVSSGWDFTNNKSNPQDNHGHGTHVAGIIGANFKEEYTVGVSQNVSIMGVKYYKEGSSGSTNLRNTIKSIKYAIDHGARIINYSGGGPEFSEEEYMALRRAEEKGVLLVAAGGNERVDSDLKKNFYYPCAYRLSNIICVVGTDIHDHMVPSSNWGVLFNDVAAPGENIFSSIPGNRYAYMSGTSQATAFVSGIAAMLISEKPSLTPQQVKDLIVRSVDKLPALKTKVGSSGRVNAYKAMKLLKNENKDASSWTRFTNRLMPE